MNLLILLTHMHASACVMPRALCQFIKKCATLILDQYKTPRLYPRISSAVNPFLRELSVTERL